MNKTAQNLTWNCLPLEVKKEVKREYQIAINAKEYYTECTLEYLFGIDNLTSNTDGEEMLTCDRDVVRMLYDRTDSVKVRQVLESIFGSKCLPDEKPLSQNPSENCDTDNHISTDCDKPAEPKYHRGEKVCYNGYVYEIEGLVGKNRYALKGLNFDLDEDMIEPYTEPEEKSCTDACTDDCSSQCKSQDFGTIVKDSFRNERRLNIAAQIVASMVGSDDWSTWRGGSNKEIWHNMAKSSLEIADALLAEVEKKGDEE